MTVRQFAGFLAALQSLDPTSADLPLLIECPEDRPGEIEDVRIAWAEGKISRIVLS